MKSFLRDVSLKIFFTTIGLVAPFLVQGIPVENPINADSVPELVNDIVTVILGSVGALALAMFVYGGMLWMTSAGNQQRVQKGKETLIWAVLGLAIIFASYAILNAVLSALSGNQLDEAALRGLSNMV